MKEGERPILGQEKKERECPILALFLFSDGEGKTKKSPRRGEKESNNNTCLLGKEKKKKKACERLL